jgi:hypothetical protein
MSLPKVVMSRRTTLFVTETLTLSVGAICANFEISPGKAFAGAHCHTPCASLESQTEAAFSMRVSASLVLKGRSSV